MDGATLVIAELTLVAAVALGLGFQQLWSLRRENKRAAAEKAARSQRPD